MLGWHSPASTFANSMVTCPPSTFDAGACATARAAAPPPPYKNETYFSPGVSPDDIRLAAFAWSSPNPWSVSCLIPTRYKYRLSFARSTPLRLPSFWAIAPPMYGTTLPQSLTSQGGRIMMVTHDGSLVTSWSGGRLSKLVGKVGGGEGGALCKP